MVTRIIWARVATVSGEREKNTHITVFRSFVAHFCLLFRKAMFKGTVHQKNHVVSKPSDFLLWMIRGKNLFHMMKVNIY